MASVTRSGGTEVTLDGQDVRVGPEGRFVFGFHRDAPAASVLTLRYPDGRREERPLVIESRDYDVQRIDGLPPKMVTPPESVLARIKAENARIAQARAQDRAQADYLTGFVWPTIGRISGIYGSQRILNGKPRRPTSRETLIRQQRRQRRAERRKYFQSRRGRRLYARRKTSVEPFNSHLKGLFPLEEQVWHGRLDNNRTMMLERVQAKCSVSIACISVSTRAPAATAKLDGV